MNSSAIVRFIVDSLWSFDCCSKLNSNVSRTAKQNECSLSNTNVSIVFQKKIQILRRIGQDKKDMRFTH